MDDILIDKSRGDHSGNRLKLLEKRLQGSSSCNDDSTKILRFDDHHSQGAMDGVSQTQPMSPEAINVVQDSDDEGDENGFGIVTFPGSRPAKRLKLMGSPANNPAASLSPPPRSMSKVATPLKERNGNRTPDTGRRGTQQKNTLQRYFATRGQDQSITSPLRNSIEQGFVDNQSTKENHWQLEREKMVGELATVRQSLAECKADRASKEEELSSMLEAKTAVILELERRLEAFKDADSSREKQVRKGLIVLATKAAAAEQEVLVNRLHAERQRLGSLVLSMAGHLGLKEEWEDGPVFLAVKKKQQVLVHHRERIEAYRKGLRKKLPPPEPPLAKGATHRPPSAGREPVVDRISPEDFVAQDEVLKAKLSSLKREDEALHKELERLEVEKQRYVRELRRLQEEETGTYQCGALLNDRYLIQKLLGKGGFSEVYQAYDLNNLLEIAVKVHKLNSGWSEAKKSSYVKHATREFNIHKSLQHPRIVALLDIFELDTNSFATVLEFCQGGDLDAHLKEHQLLPEKEAKVIMAQVFQGLAYLNEDGRRIIHYDLKPGNILFDSMGSVRITDFGLSKIAEEGNTHGMELTSQGAGTYWYLPPECFEISSRPPMISNKVDVWSAAVMHFQMLFGKRPFGEGLTQERILREDVMLNARKVTFPTKPAVSQECKDFLTRCLMYSQRERMSVLQAANDPYLQLKRPRQSLVGNQSTN